METKLLLSGIALRQPHYESLLQQKPPLAWVEVNAEPFLASDEQNLSLLRRVHEAYPISLHCSGLSIGSANDLNWQYLKDLRDLIDTIKPSLISDHLSWSSINGHHLHTFMPLPYTEETLGHIIVRVQQIQDYLGRQLLLENVTSYAMFDHNDMTEWEFMHALTTRAGCGILLDVNSLYISARNLNFNPATYLQAIHSDYIQQYHLSGFNVKQVNQRDILVDSRDRAILPAVLDLFTQVVTQHGIKGTIVEWDDNLPSLETLCLQAYRVDKIMRENYVTRKLAV